MDPSPNLGEEAGLSRDSVQLAYDAMAPVYDAFTARYDDEGWLVGLLSLLGEHGFKGSRLLDVGCGTGNSFIPMLSRGWQVTGCDISPEMLSQAEQKASDSVRLVVADMRTLPKLGEFDLVWALDDAINYLLTAEELRAAFLGMRRNLQRSGFLLFDVNELLAYRTFFAETTVVEDKGHRLVWRGLAPKDATAGLLCEARLEVEHAGARNGHERGVSVHRQRHFPETEILSALEQAGLECRGIYGCGQDGVPEEPFDESSHGKAIYVAACL
jgi:SAM-dependent methyltransferase